MKDPTRIAHVTDRLRTAWEAQPNLNFAEFFARLQPLGVARNSHDEELLDALNTVLNTHPWKHEGPAPQLTKRVNVDLNFPNNGAKRIATIGNGTISIRPHPRQADSVQPVVWRYTQIRRCRPGDPLLVEDEQGNTHRLGIVELITTINNAEPPTDISGLTSPTDGYIIRFDTQAIALLGSKLWITTVSRRETNHHTIRWEQLETAAIGKTLIVRTKTNSNTKTETLTGLGKVIEIIPL